MTALLPRKLSALFIRLLLLSCVLLNIDALAVTRSSRLPVGQKWEVYEVKFKSSIAYTNPVQEAFMNVDFVSPIGEVHTIPAFWDGGKTWRVRFAPDTLGRWVYRTTCSDANNKGLHDIPGEFLCTAAAGKTRFGLHGPLRVSDGHRHLEHQDYTPFFWVGDAAWDAGRLSAPKDWQFYSLVRASQKFNAVQWTMAPGKDFKGQTAFSGRETISINLEFFRRLEEKVATLNSKGLVSAIAPLWEIGASSEDVLPEHQAVILLRYAVARFGAKNVAWILAFEGDEAGQKAARWKNIGRSVFGQINHAPVMLLPGETPWLLDEFRNEKWMDVLGCQTARVLDEDSLQWMLTGPLTLERRKIPAKPIITLAPPAENGPIKEAGKLLDAERTRRLLWWSAILNTPAGVSYSAQGVAHWDIKNAARRPGERADLPIWQNELFLPGARDVEALGDFFGALGFWRLQPFSRAIPEQPGMESPRRYVPAAGTETGDVVIAYVPEDREVNLATGAMPPSAAVAWVNPRDGKMVKTTAEAAGTNTYRFPTPDAGDWVLVLRAGK